MAKPLDSSAGRVAARLARHLEVALGSVDLTTAQFRMLVELDEGPEVSSSLAEKLAVRPPSVTNVVDGLVQRSLVERTHSSVDRRQISLALTPAGEALLREADAVVHARLTELAAASGDDSLCTSLAAWRPALDAYRARRREQSGRHAAPTEVAR